MHRRDFLLAAATASTQMPNLLADPTPAQRQDELVRQRLRAVIPTRQQVDDFLQGVQGPDKLSRNRGWKFDGDLGWTLCDSVRQDGVDKSKTFYHYDADGSRKVLNGLGQPCRIHTYGDSFTHGDQVSDGETWQEYLAAHLQEPVRNFGIGGYSVYQAYRRMLRTEPQNPAKYIILNIFEDDHSRNLDSWRALRFGKRIPDGFTLPHLRVDVAKDRCEAIENACRKPADAYKLCDEKFVWETFKDDPVLRLLVAASDKESLGRNLAEPAAVSFGIPKEQLANTTAARKIQQIHQTAALYATRKVITWTEEFAAKHNKKLMLILSFASYHMQVALEDKPRFDQELLDWLKGKPYPIIDMRDVFRAEFKKSKQSVKDFLKPYYVGHHSPAGNFFTAWAIKDQVVKWLDPAPLPYR